MQSALPFLFRLQCSPDNINKITVTFPEGIFIFRQEPLILLTLLIVKLLPFQPKRIRCFLKIAQTRRWNSETPLSKAPEMFKWFICCCRWTLSWILGKKITPFQWVNTSNETTTVPVQLYSSKLTSLWLATDMCHQVLQGVNMYSLYKFVAAFNSIIKNSRKIR